MKWTKCFVSWQ